MNKTVITCGTFILAVLFSLNTVAQHVGQPIGFATVTAYGVSEITGGRGGEVVVINGQNDAKKLQDALADDKHRIIYISGTIQLPQYPAGTLIPVEDVTLRMTLVGSNKTILGVNNAKIVKSGFSIFTKPGSGEGNPQPTGVNNIIIQNITFENAPDDNINIQGGSHHIWIDHCTFTDGGSPNSDNDGQIDIKRGSDFITVSYCFFTNHYKMCLVGHSNKAKEIDTGHLRVTFDHCYWKDGGGSKTSSRHPRVRFGSVHVLNCLIQGASADKMCEGVVSQCDAKVWIEGTHFSMCKSGGSTSEHSEGDGYVMSTNNSNDNCGDKFGFGRTFSSTAEFSYRYNAENSSSVKSTLPGKAGANIIKINQVALHPINVSANANIATLTISRQGSKKTMSAIPAFANSASVNILNIAGRTIISTRPLSGSRHSGYTLVIDGLTSGTYLLTDSENNAAVIGTINIH